MPLGPSGDIPIKQFLPALAKLGIFIHNYATGETFSNDLWREWGYTDEDMEDIYWMDILHPEDKRKAQEAMKLIRENKTDRFDLIYRVQTKDGTLKWIYNSGMFLSRDEEGNPALFIGADRDITDLKQSGEKLSQALILAEKRTLELETLQSAGKAVTSILDLKEAVDMILTQAQKVIPYDTASVLLLQEDGLHIVGTMEWIEQIQSHNIIPLSANTPCSQVLSRKEALLIHKPSDFEQMPSGIPGKEASSWIGVPLIINNKTLGILSCYSQSPHQFNEDHLRLAAGFGDYMAIAVNNAQNHEQMINMATTDPLTRIHNRRWFFENGNRLFAQATRYHWSLAVMMLDLDNFKVINDSYGHKMGDEILIKSSRIFAEEIRQSDLFCRYGGEEFCILLPETEEKTACSIADRILNNLRTIVLPDPKRRISVSIGIASRIPHQDLTLDGLIILADEALYSAKYHGKDCWKCR